jgi:hypothetical protein
MKLTFVWMREVYSGMDLEIDKVSLIAVKQAWISNRLKWHTWFYIGLLATRIFSVSCFHGAAQVTTSVLRAIQRVGESYNVAPATCDLCDDCKTTERHASDSAEDDRNLQICYADLAVLSNTSVVDSQIDMLAGAYTPAPTACHGCSPVRATASSGIYRDVELPAGL